MQVDLSAAWEFYMELHYHQSYREHFLFSTLASEANCIRNIGISFNCFEFHPHRSSPFRSCVKFDASPIWYAYLNIWTRLLKPKLFLSILINCMMLLKCAALGYLMLLHLYCVQLILYSWISSHFYFSAACVTKFRFLGFKTRSNSFSNLYYVMI